MSLLSELIHRIRHMLFGIRPPAPFAQAHAEDMRKSSERRHELVGEQAEMERRLYFLKLEAQADAGWHGPRQGNPSDCR